MSKKKKTVGPDWWVGEVTRPVIPKARSRRRFSEAHEAIMKATRPSAIGCRASPLFRLGRVRFSKTRRLFTNLEDPRLAPRVLQLAAAPQLSPKIDLRHGQACMQWQRGPNASAKIKPSFSWVTNGAAETSLLFENRSVLV